MSWINPIIDQIIYFLLKKCVINNKELLYSLLNSYIERLR